MPPITNIFYTNQTLNFPSTAAGSFSDLPAVTNAVIGDGDAIKIGVGSAAMQGGGCFQGFCSNAVVWIRFINNNLVSAIDPPSATFTIQTSKQ